MGIEAITDREKQIIRMVSNALASTQIAKRLAISVRTVDAHRRNAMAKLGVNNAADMIKICKAEGLIQTKK